ncbi:hypothetical protein [Oceanidesulfovibrio marinus]|nr:hypothetical protein [Oceanidesulfovibrio marinus]
MSYDNETMQNAIQDISRLMQFENWIRFYFIREEDDTLYVRIPDEAVKRIEEEYPLYISIVEELNNKPIDYEKSMATLCKQVVTIFEGDKYPFGISGDVFDTKDFQAEMHLFNVWVQSHESQLDQAFMDFSTWQEIFGEWRQDDRVKEYFEKLCKHAINTTVKCESDTVH